MPFSIQITCQFGIFSLRYPNTSTVKPSTTRIIALQSLLSITNNFDTNNANSLILRFIVSADIIMK
ncbi:hypothetical protein J6590_086610, partial [Homalodisca vitripennis]